MRGLKEKAARSGWLSFVVGALTCGSASTTHAEEHAEQPRVLLLQPEAAPGGLFTALQIQLAGIAVPERILWPVPPTAAQRIEAAGELARAREALCAVSVDPPPARTDAPAVLYAVGERQGRALIEVVRVPGGAGPELDRTLALKVREIVTELVRARAAAPPEALLLQPPAAPAPTPAAAPRSTPQLAAESPPRRVQALVAVAARLGSQPRIGLGRWGLGLAAGPVFTLPRLRFSAQLGADWFPAVTVSRGGDRASFSEVAGALTLQGQHRIGEMWLGAQLGPQHLWLHAQGTTAQELSGSPQSESLWAIMAGVSAETPLSPQLGLAAELQLQTLLRDQRFTVNGLDVVEFGRVRARLGVILIFRPFDR